MVEAVEKFEVNLTLVFFIFVIILIIVNPVIIAKISFFSKTKGRFDLTNVTFCSISFCISHNLLIYLCKLPFLIPVTSWLASSGEEFYYLGPVELLIFERVTIELILVSSLLIGFIWIIFLDTLLQIPNFPLHPLQYFPKRFLRYSRKIKRVSTDLILEGLEFRVLFEIN